VETMNDHVVHTAEGYRGILEAERAAAAAAAP
jgi:hypothetical protein